MPRFSVSCFLLVLLSIPVVAAPRRRAVAPPAALTADAIIAIATRAADRVTLGTEPRLHWENASYLDGLVLFGEEMNRRDPAAGDRLIERAASVILDSDDDIVRIFWGDGTAFAQVALDLYRVLPPSDPRRAALLATPPVRWVRRARHSRYAVDRGAARSVVDRRRLRHALLAGRHVHGHALAGDERLVAGRAAGERAGAEPRLRMDRGVCYDHRPASSDPREVAVPSAAARNGFFLWDRDDRVSFSISRSGSAAANVFWGRGNGWSCDRADARRAVSSMLRTPARRTRPWSVAPMKSATCCAHGGIVESAADARRRMGTRSLASARLPDRRNLGHSDDDVLPRPRNQRRAGSIAMSTNRSSCTPSRYRCNASAPMGS